MIRDHEDGPEPGDLSGLWCAGAGGKAPDNEATRAAMERLAADPVEHHFPCWPAHQARTRELLTI